MNLRITDHETSGVTILKLDGRIVLGEETNSLREKVKSLLGMGKKKFVLDLKGVTMMDSSGLGTLVSVHHSTTKAGGALRLCNLGSRMNEVLQVTRLLTEFEVSNSEADAVKSLSN